MKLNNKEIFITLLEENDAEHLLDLELKNREFFQLYTGSKKEEFYTLVGQRKKIISSIQHAEEGTAYFFAIYLADTNELIGKITLSEVLRGDFQGCWIGYTLDKAHNGKGYTTEAVKLTVEFAFKECQLHRIEAGVMPHNQGSIRVLEKAGFHKEGVAKKNVRINGKWEDHQILAILNPYE